MKYWWLDKYRKLEIKELPSLLLDIKYFIVLPKNYEKIYERTEKLEISKLKEEELLIHLAVIVSSKNIKNNRLIKIIERLLIFPDTNLPISDYSLKEILQEIKNLKTNYPVAEKMDNNNVVACYKCLQIFYVDYISAVNKKGLCLCPFCHNHFLYFDNDYIPMNYSFLKLASIYYGTSLLGSNFRDIQKIFKKNVHLTMGDAVKTNIVIQEKKTNKKHEIIPLPFSFHKLKKITSQEEKEIIKDLFDTFRYCDEKMEYEVTLRLEKIPSILVERISFLILLSLMEILSQTIYLKNVNILCDNLELYNIIKSQKRIIELFT